MESSGEVFSLDILSHRMSDISPAMLVTSTIRQMYTVSKFLVC
jgi:hypothetical protein